MLPCNCSMMIETKIEERTKKIEKMERKKTLEWESNCRCHKLLQHKKAQNEEN